MSISNADIERTLQRVEKVLSRDQRGEAAKGSFLAEYERCGSTLQVYLDSGECSERVRYLHALLANRQEHWRLAVARWHDYFKVAETPCADAFLHCATAYRYIGDFQSSRRMLKKAQAQAQAEGADEVMFRRERRRLRRAKQTKLQSDAGQSAVQALAGGGEEDPIPFARAAFEMKGVPEAAMPGLLRLTDDLRELVPAIAASTKVRRLDLVSYLVRLLGLPQSPAGFDGTRVIFSAGFGFSGSGATTDFLADHDEVELAFGRREFEWFDSRSGSCVTSFMDLHKAALRKDPALAAVVLSFYVGTVLGLGCFNASQGNGSEFVLNRDPGMLAHFVHDADAVCRFSESSRELLKILQPACVNGAAHRTVVMAVRAFVSRTVNARTSEGKHCLFDNCIKASQGDVFNLVGGGRMVITRRDPRDQFVSRVRESRSGEISAEKFVANYSRRERRVRRALWNPSIKARTAEVQFENLVLDDATRDSLRERFNLQKKTVPEDQVRFRPADSAKNIGIHKEWECQSDIEYISRKLRKHLVPAAD